MAARRSRSSIGPIFYDLRYRIGEYALRAFVRCLPWIPKWLPQLYLAIMSRLSFALLWKYRTRMEENVAMALGNEFADGAQRKKMVWRAWHNFARGVLETSLAMHDSKPALIAKINLTGEEHLQRALAKGKGVLALSAHLGGFTLIGARLAAAGYPFSVVVKHPGNERFARLIDNYRAQLGMQTISAKPRREAVRGILKALRQNRIVLVIADEFKSGDVMIDFFGQHCAAPRGPASLALRTGAATLPMFATRQPDGSMLLAIDAPIDPVQSDDLEASVAATTAVYSGRLEAEIRRYPDQWNWLGFPRRDRGISRVELARRAGLRRPLRKPGAWAHQSPELPPANGPQPAVTRARIDEALK